MNADLIKELRDEAARLIGYGVDNGSQEATIAGNLANRAADALETASVANKREHYMRGYHDGWKEASSETLTLLREANAFILAPAEDLKDGILSRLRAEISKAAA